MTPSKDSHGGHRIRNLVVFCLILLVMISVDQGTKHYFNEFAVGETIAVPLPGVIDFTLVHNTGGAWGMFGDATVVLACVSAVVCIVGFAYVAAYPQASLPMVVGISLVVAGGCGNLCDRIGLGYVVDFIRLTFIDFPVFNVADICVTSGIALLVIALVVEWRHTTKGDGQDVSGGDASASERAA